MERLDLQRFQRLISPEMVEFWTEREDSFLTASQAMLRKPEILAGFG